ncbi:MAG: hypothetical protein M2R45_02172 [Verrucomicrobia subdivision 3 bacterium]|nr:hypothetical protein [Limisphaerales bacterium]MCS1413748.1 hypothetical protein [Limisphaerales bacterium]
MEGDNSSRLRNSIFTVFSRIGSKSHTAIDRGFADIIGNGLLIQPLHTRLTLHGLANPSLGISNISPATLLLAAPTTPDDTGLTPPKRHIRVTLRIHTLSLECS